MSVDRFEHIVSFLPECAKLAEIGCDHAKLTERAFERGKCVRAVVSDISDKCLAKARETLAGREGVTFVTGDGITPESLDADCLLICGMGGHAIRDMLSRYVGSATLVLSPQSHAELVREALLGMGYAIGADECFKADGKYYDVLRAVRGAQSLTDLQIRYGVFYKTKNAALREKLEMRLAALERGGERNAARMREVREVLSWQK